MKSGIVALTLMATLVSGCFISKQVPGEAAEPTGIYDTSLTTPGADLVRVTVVRDTGVLGANCPYLIFVDTRQGASLMPGQKVDLYLKPGDYILSLRHPPKGLCKWGQVVQQSMSVKAGTPLHYRAGYYDETYILEPTAF